MSIHIIPGQIENLRPENWRELSIDERLATFRGVEAARATEDMREPADIQLLRPEDCRSYDDFLHTRGSFQAGELTEEGNRQPGTIRLNPGMVIDSKSLYLKA